MMVPGVIGEVGVGDIRGVASRWTRACRGRSGPRRPRPRRTPDPAPYARRSRRSPAGGREVESSMTAVPQGVHGTVSVATTIPSVHGWCTRPAVLLAPRPDEALGGREPKAARESVAHSFGMSMPLRARSTEVPPGPPVTARPPAVVVVGDPSVGRRNRWRAVWFWSRLAGSLSRRVPPGEVGREVAERALTGIGVRAAHGVRSDPWSWSQRSCRRTKDSLSVSALRIRSMTRHHGSTSIRQGALAAGPLWRRTPSRSAPSPRRPSSRRRRRSSVADHRAGQQRTPAVHRQVEGPPRHRYRAGRRPGRFATGGRSGCHRRDRRRSPRRMPKSVSTMPPCLTLPASWKTWVPRERPDSESGIRLTAVGEDHRDGRERQDVVDDGRLAKEPTSARIGGLARTSPRFPSRLSSIEVSSPQM